MLQVYNYYQGPRTPERPQRYTAHKRSELKNIYKSITDLSAKESLYKIDLSADQQNYAVGIKDTSLSVQGTLNDLADPSAYHLLAAVSNRPEEVSAKLLPSKEERELESFFVDVKQLATAQENEGFFLPATKSSLPTGAYSFAITIDDCEYSFQFQVTKDTSNLDSQNKLADFINQTGIGIHAKVDYNKETGLSRLTLTSEHAGNMPDRIFYTEDTSWPEKAGAANGVLSYFGLLETTREAKNTVVTINNETFEFPEKEFTYDNKVKLTFSDVTNEPVQVRITTDAKPVLEKLTAFTDTYNHLISKTRNFGSQNRRSQKLLYEFSHFTALHQSDFRKAGITLTEEGFLQIDKQAATESILSQNTRNLFAKDSSFTKALSARMHTVSLNPMDYVDKLIVVYPNTHSKSSVNPYVTSLYSGMLFNNYC